MAYRVLRNAQSRLGENSSDITTNVSAHRINLGCMSRVERSERDGDEADRKQRAHDTRTYWT